MNHRRVELTSLSIGKVARRAGIGVETIRFYEREGLLAAPARRDIGPVHQPETILASLRRSASSDSNAEVDAIRVLPDLFQSAYWRLSWAGRRTEAFCLGRSSRCSTVF
jgi:hypothetical protein